MLILESIKADPTIDPQLAEAMLQSVNTNDLIDTITALKAQAENLKDDETNNLIC